MVVAQPAGQSPLVRDVPSGFAEGCVLLQSIGDVRVERGVDQADGVGAEREPCGRIEGVVSRRGQILSIAAANMLEEPTYQPIDCRLPVRGQAQFFRRS